MNDQRGAQRRRIAINGRFLDQRITGVQRMAREFTRALDRLLAEGHFPDLDVRLLVQPDAPASDLGLTAIEVESVGKHRGHLWEQFALPRRSRGGWLLNLGNTAPVLSLLARAPVAVVIHDISYRVHPFAYRLLYRIGHRILDTVIMRRARVIFTVSATERKMISSFYPAAAPRICAIQNGGAPDDASPVKSLDPSLPTDRYGLYVGSLSRRKNVYVVLEAAVALARSRGLKFKIVGAPSRILHNISLSIPADVREAIEFCGQVEDVKELGSLYGGAAFLLFPSLYEASALPPIEAMASGCPVIASGIEALRERCGDAAAYCDPNDRDQIEKIATRLLDDPAYRNMLIDRGIRKAAEYSWRGQAIMLVEELLRRSDKRA